MNVTREVITDLLPVYFSDEASADTKQLVEEFFQRDPEFAHLARRMGNMREKLVRDMTAPEAASEKVSLQKTRQMVRARNNLLGLAVAYTLSPLLFFRHHGQWWFMFRDSPQMAQTFIFIGFFFWVVYFFYRFKARGSGL